MKVGVLGDGPAGILAAWLFREAGHSVDHWGQGKPAPQASHIHICDPRFEVLADRLGLKTAPTESSWHFIVLGEDEQTRRDWMGPRLGREACLSRFSGSIGTVLPIPRHDNLTDFDLLIDATGGVRAFVRMFETEGLEASLIECGSHERYRSWHGHGESQVYSLIRKIGRDPIYLETTPRSWRMTIIESTDNEPRSNENLTAWLRQWNIDVDLRSLKPKQMWGPLARRVSASDWVNCDRPILPFGDALVQTSPALGFGLLSVVQQALILKNWLSSEREPAALAGDLDEYAGTIWHEAALSALII